MSQCRNEPWSTVYKVAGIPMHQFTRSNQINVSRNNIKSHYLPEFKLHMQSSFGCLNSMRHFFVAIFGVTCHRAKSKTNPHSLQIQTHSTATQ